VTVYLQPAADGPGSIQHFWHFVFGYLLPAVDALPPRSHLARWLDRFRRPDRRPPEYLFESCGPLMDPVLRECFEAFRLRYTIEEKQAILARQPPPRRLPLEHWDAFTLQPEHQPALRQRLTRVVPRLRRVLINRCPCRRTHGAFDKVLILMRSPEPAFYAPGGGAQVSGYGAARRRLANPEAIRDHFQQAGHPAGLYEPGVHSLACQMEVFTRARGIIGIKGAEWANLIWTPPGTPVYLLTPARRPLPYQRRLAECRDLPFTERICDSDTPEVDPQHALDFFVHPPPRAPSPPNQPPPSNT